jgi:hypothetical protein
MSILLKSLPLTLIYVYLQGVLAAWESWVFNILSISLIEIRLAVEIVKDSVGEFVESTIKICKPIDWDKYLSTRQWHRARRDACFSIPSPRR